MATLDYATGIPGIITLTNKGTYNGEPALRNIQFFMTNITHEIKPGQTIMLAVLNSEAKKHYLEYQSMGFEVKQDDEYYHFTEEEKTSLITSLTAIAGTIGIADVTDLDWEKQKEIDISNKITYIEIISGISENV